MPTHLAAAAVIYAKDITRVSAFYAAVAGLDRTHAERAHIILESPAFQLVVLAVPTRIAASITLTTPPTRRTDVAIKPVFFVPSIAAAREAAARLGGELNPPERQWTFQGATVCDGHDPEGNVFQLRERPA
jgi:predicted enzyme related to lactoylglutathione lyase